MTSSAGPDGSLRTRPGERLAGAAILLAVVGVVASGWAAMLDPGTSYAWAQNMISDLGRVGCRSWHGRFVCSPRHELFNVALVGSGLLVVGAAIPLRRLWGPLLSASMAALGIGLMILGAFPSDVARDIHLAGATLALPTPGAGLLVSGFRPATAWLSHFARLRAVLGLLTLTVSAQHLLPDDVGLVPRGAAEYAAMLALMTFLLVEVSRLLPPVEKVPCRHGTAWLGRPDQ